MGQPGIEFLVTTGIVWFSVGDCLLSPVATSILDGILMDWDISFV
jgi:hypothetical protein